MKVISSEGKTAEISMRPGDAMLIPDVGSLSPCRCGEFDAIAWHVMSNRRKVEASKQAASKHLQVQVQ